MCLQTQKQYIKNIKESAYREYLCKNEEVRETVFARSYGAQVESFKQKMGDNLVTLSL